MKQLQNKFTTPEQSKRLLELGVPEWTCDCCYHATCEDFINWVVKDPPQVMPAPFAKGRTRYKSWDNMPIVHCWSVGRLMEIADLCYDSILPNSREYYIKIKDCNTDYLIKMFELCANSMDFSKLED